MTEADVAAVVEFYDAWNAGGPIAELVERHFTQDATWHTPSDLPDAAIYAGRADVAASLEQLTATLGRFRCDIHEQRAVGGEVLIRFDLVGDTPGAGVPVRIEIVHLHAVRDGRIARLRAYRDRDAALAAADGG